MEPVGIKEHNLPMFTNEEENCAVFFMKIIWGCLPYTWDRKMCFIHVNGPYVNVTYANVAHVKQIIMFLKITIIK